MKTIIEQIFDASQHRGYGKCSTFGGADDTGVGPNEGLALGVLNDLHRFDSPLNGLWLPVQPMGTTGMARRLNQWAFYCACRWDYSVTPIEVLRHSYVILIDAAKTRCALCRPVDWGPAARTGRVIDLSPGAAGYLGVETGDSVSFALWTPYMFGALLNAPSTPT